MSVAVEFESGTKGEPPCLVRRGAPKGAEVELKQRTNGSIMLGPSCCCSAVPSYNSFASNLMTSLHARRRAPVLTSHNDKPADLVYTFTAGKLAHMYRR